VFQDAITVRGSGRRIRARCSTCRRPPCPQHTTARAIVHCRIRIACTASMTSSRRGSRSSGRAVPRWRAVGRTPYAGDRRQFPRRDGDSSTRSREARSPAPGKTGHLPPALGGDSTRGVREIVGDDLLHRENHHAVPGAASASQRESAARFVVRQRVKLVDNMNSALASPGSGGGSSKASADSACIVTLTSGNLSSASPAHSAHA